MALSWTTPGGLGDVMRDGPTLFLDGKLFRHPLIFF
jgi:hypothetical protein